jgi:hypothetical protein
MKAFLKEFWVAFVIVFKSMFKAQTWNDLAEHLSKKIRIRPEIQAHIDRPHDPLLFGLFIFCVCVLCGGFLIIGLLL